MLSKIINPLTKSLEVRNVNVFLKAGTDGDLAGNTRLDIYALKNKIPIPDLDVTFDLNYIVKKYCKWYSQQIRWKSYRNCKKCR